MSNDLPPPELCQKSSSNKEWEEFSGPLFSDVEKLNLWDEKKSEGMTSSGEEEAVIQPTVRAKSRQYGWWLCVAAIVTAAAVFTKVPGIGILGSAVPSREVQILKKDFAQLERSKSARFDKVFSNTIIDRPKFNLAMVDDGARIWMGVSTRAFYRFEIDFRSVPNHVMGSEPIHFSTVGQIQEGLAVIAVKNFSFGQGKKVEAGLYEVTLRASRADNIARWLRVLNENNFTKTIVNSLSSYISPLEITLGPEKILLSPGDEKEAAIQIETYLVQIKENKRRPLLEQQQNVLTLQSLLYKLGDLMNEYRTQGLAGKVSYIRTYAKEVAPALQVLAVPTPKTQILDAKGGDPDLVIPGPTIWSTLDTAEMAKKLAMLSVQFVESLSTPGAKKRQIQKSFGPEKILDDLSAQLTTKADLLEQELSSID